MVCDGSGQELLFDGYSGLLGGADGEACGLDGGVAVVVDGLQDDLIVAWHEDNAFGGVGGIEVADPFDAVRLEYEDAASGWPLGFGQCKLSGKGNLQVGVGVALDFDVGEMQDREG